jgi:hypothetical protein
LANASVFEILYSMARLLLILIALLFSFTNVQSVSAQSLPFTNPAGKTFSLPEEAIKVSENVYNLGKSKDPQTGKEVEGMAFIHYKKTVNHQKPLGSGAKPSSCYTFMGSGVKWKVAEPWLVNPTNTRNLDHLTIFSILTNAVSKWEDATDGNVINGTGNNVLGDGTVTYDLLEADSATLDNKNEVLFADITDSNAIGVTIVWGVWSGPTFRREIVEWDQIYDDVTYDWSSETVGLSGKMDFDNIATHEMGHSFGLGDLYNSCTNETMYGYAGEGEINKRDLNTGDIAGVNSLY